MKKLKWYLIAFGFIALALLATWWMTHGSWRYKVTVSVETPEGIKTGYAVREAWATAGGPSLLPGNTQVRVKGEAVVVDLGARGVVYAVMGTNDEYTVFKAFPKEGATTAEGIRYYRSLKPGTHTSLAIEDRPLIVTFKDPNDPRSVTAVYQTSWMDDPADSSERIAIVKEDNFEKVFGKGVRLKDITVEITDEKVTRGEVVEHLPTFDAEYWEWLTMLDYNDPRRITPANFY